MEKLIDKKPQSKKYMEDFLTDNIRRWWFKSDWIQRHKYAQNSFLISQLCIAMPCFGRQTSKPVTLDYPHCLHTFIPLPFYFIIAAEFLDRNCTQMKRFTSPKTCPCPGSLHLMTAHWGIWRPYFLAFRTPGSRVLEDQLMTQRLIPTQYSFSLIPIPLFSFSYRSKGILHETPYICWKSVSWLIWTDEKL
jgi:hypothetical protein